MPSRCAASVSARTITPRGRGERVVALLARGRARVVGAARELDLQAQPRRQPRDHAGGPAGGRDVARLVDVQLEEAAQPLQPLRSARQPGRVDARVGHRISERHTVLVHALDSVVDVEPPDQRARAERRRVEARALLVRERDHGERHARPLRHGERGGDAERAVEPPAAAHAVEVRAGRPPRAGRVRARPQVARAGRAPSAARSPPPGARTSPPPPRPRASTPAASCRSPRRSRSGSGRRAARRGRSAAITGAATRPPRRRSPRAPGCARTGTGRARPACRAPRGRPACPTSIDPIRSEMPSTHAAFSVHAASASRADQP